VLGGGSTLRAKALLGVPFLGVVMDRSFGSRGRAVAGGVALVASAVLFPLAAVSAAPASSSSWRSLGSLPTTLQGFAFGTSKSGGLIVAGGTTGVNTGASRTVYTYTAASNSWAATGNTSATYNGVASVTGTNGDLYVYAGGLLIYSPKTGAWSAGPNLPAKLNSPSMAALPSGQILVIGAASVKQGAVNETYSYSPSTGKWTTLAPMPANGGCESRAAATGPTGLVYSAGGSCYGSSFDHKLFIFDATTNSWTEGAAMPGTAVYGGSSAAFGGNGMLYVMGGGNFSPLTQVMKYDPSTNKWAKGPSLPVASSFGGAVKLRSGDVVYAGGVGANGTLSNVWELSTK